MLFEREMKKKKKKIYIYTLKKKSVGDHLERILARLVDVGIIPDRHCLLHLSRPTPTQKEIIFELTKGPFPNLTL